MEKIFVEGGRPLVGSFTVSGAKNSVLPLMAASLLTDDEVFIHNVPDVRDVRTQCRILEALGAEVRHDREEHTLRIRVIDTTPITAPYELVSTMRASICVLGPVLARRGRARVSRPGGCVLGNRPIDLHIKGMRALGAEIEEAGGYVEARAARLRGRELFLGGPFGSTVTGTANVVMAASLAQGVTVVENAALEPELEDLCKALVQMGARIEGIGTHRIRIEGVEKLSGFEVRVIPDRIEAGTFLIGAVMTGGDVTALGARSDHMTAVLEILRQAGAEVWDVEGGIRARGPANLRGIDVTTFSYPGFPTDLQAQVLAMATRGEGISVITEKIYPDRFIHAAELNRMGANIRKEGSQAIVAGVRQLSGAPVMASDLRASAALILAGLVARGLTEVHRVYHIDRGYEAIDRKLESLGARVWRGD